MIRSAGVLMPVSSLPSPYGIGTFGKEAYRFVDFLKEAGQTYWQILPVGPTGYGNSPYQSLSSYAGNPYFIDLELLVEEGLLYKWEVEQVTWEKEEDHVDYGILYNERYKLLRKACTRLPQTDFASFEQFLYENKHWLKDYAVFMAIKNDRNGEPWVKWPKELRNHSSEEVRNEAYRLIHEVFFWERVQYLFFKQMKALKKYANDNNIRIIGDLPFYAAQDSIDVWANPEQFDVDNQTFEMTYVAGFGPDSGNPEGQKWGNPLFNWEYQRNHGYDWWIDRAKHTLAGCDVLRIDHFRGYQTFFAIPADRPASEGHWRQGPGLELFRKLEQSIPQTDIIVEDLGQLTPEFLQMVDESGYPGMRIMEYAFDPYDPNSLYMPFNYPKNTVVYTGTHDNNTLVGWLNDENQQNRVQRAAAFLGLNEEEGYQWGMLRGAYASASDLAIIPMQDLIGLDADARMNDPAGGSDPWSWRALPEEIDEELAKNLREKMFLFHRFNWANQ